jgi:hypothetical protein
LAKGAAGLRGARDDLSLAITLPLLAYVQQRRGSEAEAASLAHEGLQLAHDLHARQTAGWALLVAAFVNAHRAPAQAARWLAAAQAAYDENRWTWELIEVRVRDAAAAALREALGDAKSSRQREAGQRQDDEDRKHQFTGRFCSETTH